MSYRLFWMISLACFLLGCAKLGYLPTSFKIKSLQKSSERYNELLRWGDFSGAGSFVKEEERKDFFSQAERLSDSLHIVDYRIENLTFQEDEGIVRVRIEYHKAPYFNVITIIQTQRWSLIGGKWFVSSTLQDFLD